MCGIIGYTGKENALPHLIAGLKTLEYRGYDSSGVALQGSETLCIKSKGRISELEEKLASVRPEASSCGIGHTRWATHGSPSDINAHPHSTERLSLVHNGIIENYSEIKSELEEKGYKFISQTDTEIAAGLIDFFYSQTKDPISSIFSATRKMRGSFAFGIIFNDIKGKIFAIRRDSPLIVSSNENGAFLASDIPAILKHSSSYFRLDENIVAVLDGKSIEFFNSELQKVEQRRDPVLWSSEEAKKGGFPHFMLKEIFETPNAIKKTLSPRISTGLPHFDCPLIDTDKILDFSAIHIVACGTAMHAGLFGKYMLEKLARIPVCVEIASEFRYADPILNKNDLVILLSQSGETADTLAALRHAKAKGIHTLAIVNVMDSSVAREADEVIYTLAGPEIAVASTKAYSVQCALLYLLALRFSLSRGLLKQEELKAICSSLISDLPRAIEETLKLQDEAKATASRFTDTEHFFYIGRGIDRYLCTEASLKLKEISYIHSEAYAAGELKHGTISLITDDTPVLALLTESELAEKMISGIREVKSRGAFVIAVCSHKIAQNYDVPCDVMLKLPDVDPTFAPFCATILLQLFAYFLSDSKGLDVDKPRNLAKSVTVE